MATLSLNNAVKRYGDQTIVHGLNLDVADREFIVLVGPSGCGKSTTLRMVAGLESVSDGTVQIDGRTVNQVPPQDRDIAMVFQNYALYPHMTVRDNIAFGLKMRRQPQAEIAMRVQEAAALLQIEHLLDRKPAALSGGQRQRVAMGRAIVRDPKVFLMDEPLSNLDAKLRVDMRHQIKALHARLGATILYVTHDQIEAMTLGDRIVVMKDGHVMQIGTPLELYNHPGNVFVAGFIGNPGMNFLPASAAGGRLTHAGQTLLEGVGAPAETLLGLRPEHLSLAEVPGGGAVSGTVSLIEPLGGQTQVLLDTGVSTLTARLDGQPQLQPGQPLTLHFARSALHLFDPQTEQALPVSQEVSL